MTGIHMIAKAAAGLSEDSSRGTRVLLGFEGHFQWMIDCRWTVKEIQASFRVPVAIAKHIQGAGWELPDAMAIANAHHELASQIGF